MGTKKLSIREIQRFVEEATAFANHCADRNLPLPDAAIITPDGKVYCVEIMVDGDASQDDLARALATVFAEKNIPWGFVAWFFGGRQDGVTMLSLGDIQMVSLEVKWGEGKHLRIADWSEPRYCECPSCLGHEDNSTPMSRLEMAFLSGNLKPIGEA